MLSLGDHYEQVTGIRIWDGMWSLTVLVSSTLCDRRWYFQIRSNISRSCTKPLYTVHVLNFAFLCSFFFSLHSLHNLFNEIVRLNVSVRSIGVTGCAASGMLYFKKLKLTYLRVFANGCVCRCESDAAGTNVDLCIPLRSFDEGAGNLQVHADTLNSLQLSRSYRLMTIPETLHLQQNDLTLRF